MFTFFLILEIHPLFIYLFLRNQFIKQSLYNISLKPVLLFLKKNIYSCRVEAEDWFIIIIIIFFLVGISKEKICSFIFTVIYRQLKAQNEVSSGQDVQNKIGWAQITIWKIEGTLYLVDFGLGLIVSIFILLDT